MVAGLEIMRNEPCIQRQKMFYWEKNGKSVAEIDYLEIHNMKITPYRNQIRHTRRHEESMAIHEREKTHRCLPLFS